MKTKAAKTIVSTFLALILCFSMFSTTVFAAGPLDITPSSPTYSVGEEVTIKLFCQDGGYLPTTGYYIKSGSLPPGLAVSDMSVPPGNENRYITGYPTTSGSFSAVIGIQAGDGTGEHTNNLSITILDLEASISAPALDYTNETITGFMAGNYSFSGQNGSVSTVSGSSHPIDTAWFGTSLSIVRKGDHSTIADTTPLDFAIPARPAAPSVTPINATTVGGTGGINGTTTAMEYSTSATGPWTDCAAGSTTGLAQNTYYVRTKAVANTSFASEQIPVVVAATTSKAVTSFTLASATGTIDEGAGTIDVTVPHGTNVTNLVPTIVHTGDTISPASGAAVDFTNPVTYTVTAADGTTKIYTVTVNVAANTAKDITALSIGGVNGTISGTNISVTMPYGTNKASLTPTITHTGASISPASGTAQDFTNPVAYTVTAADGSTKNYIVTVNVAANDAKDITALSIGGVNGTISGTNISVTMPYGTNKASLTPTITHTGASISPASGTVQDFTNPVAYTVTAADGSTKTYTATVTLAPANAHSISINASPANGGNPSANPALASVGSTVTLNPSPNAQYIFKEWIVDSPPGLTITGNRFIMPDAPVSITAAYTLKGSILIPFDEDDGSSDTNTFGNNGTTTQGGTSGTERGTGGYTGGNGLPTPGGTIVADPAKTGETSTVGGKTAVGIISAAPNVKAGTPGSSALSTSEAGKQTAYSKAQFEKDWALALANLDGKKAVLIRGINYSAVDKAVLDHAYQQAKAKALTLAFHFDEVAGRNTTSRLYITPTAKNTSYDLMSEQDSEDSIAKLLSKDFINSLYAVSFEKTGSIVRVAAEIPDGVTMKNPAVYSYNTETSTYNIIKNAKIWLDSNGYVHFTAPQGIYIISNGELAKK